MEIIQKLSEFKKLRKKDKKHSDYKRTVEIAKEYSTPKSGKFVNGILDTLSKNLIKEGKIRKSGRGLLDNK